MLEEILDTDKDSVKLRKTLKVLKYVSNRLNREMSSLYECMPDKYMSMNVCELGKYVDSGLQYMIKNDVNMYMSFLDAYSDRIIDTDIPRSIILDINTCVMKIGVISKIMSSIKLLSKGKFLDTLRNDDKLYIDKRLNEIYSIVNDIIMHDGCSAYLHGKVTNEVVACMNELRPVYDIYLFMEKIKEYGWKIGWTEIYSILDRTFNILDNSDEFNTMSKATIESSEVKRAYNDYKVNIMPHIIAVGDNIDIDTLHKILRSNGQVRTLLMDNGINVDDVISLLEICNMGSKYDYILCRLRLCIYSSIYMKLTSSTLKKSI